MSNDTNQLDPWTPKQMVKVNGLALVYTWKEGQGLLIHFPGGKSEYAHDVMHRGADVELPEIIRGQKRKYQPKKEQ